MNIGIIQIFKDLVFFKDDNNWTIVNTERRVELSITCESLIKMLNNVNEMYNGHYDYNYYKDHETLIELLLVTLITIIEKGDI